MIGYSYFGLMDDVVDRFPFEFSIDEKRIKFELITQLIDGKPLFLNDGYLVLHPVCSKSIQDQDGLVWNLLTRGFITVLHRGGDDYRLDEMPEAMADRNVESYQKLVTDRLPGFIRWEKYKAILSHIHDILQGTRSYRKWPPYKSESGFIALSNRLINNNISLSQARMRGMCWSSSAVKGFIEEFVSTFDPSISGPRNYWESLAKKYSKKLSVTYRPKAFTNRMMSLANELYHYNFGVMLSAQEGVPISVETRHSRCFDFLLESKEYLAEEEIKIPKLSIPQSILTAPDSQIAQIFDDHRPVGQCRSTWLELKSKFHIDSSVKWEEINETGVEYSKEISSLLGGNVDFGIKEDVFGYTLGKLSGEVRGDAAASVGSAAGSFGGPVGTAIGAVAGYGLAKAHKHFAGKITDKIKVKILNKKLIKDLEGTSSSKVAKNIPSSYTIDKEIADKLILEYENV